MVGRSQYLALLVGVGLLLLVVPVIAEGEGNRLPVVSGAGDGIVVFVRGQNDRGNFRLRSVDPMTSTVESIAGNRPFFGDPQISPDGMNVAAEGGRKGLTTSNIWTLSIDGSSAKKITHARADFYPRWSPNGKWIAYVHTGRSRSTLNIIRPSGQGRQQLATSDPRAGALDASWAPDSKRLVFASLQTKAGGERVSSIRVIRIDGSGERVLATGRDRIDVAEPDWSPSSSGRIAFVREDSSVAHHRAHLITVQADGSDSMTVASGKATKVFPTWSPSGEDLAYLRCSRLSDSNQVICALMTMAGDGSSKIRVSRADAHGFAWSPDSSQLVLSLSKTTDFGLNQEDLLWITGADGTGGHELTSPRAGVSDISPDW